jgi:hypothetical protein
MFEMSSKRQMLLYRAGFILLCVVPTLIVAIGAVIPNRPRTWEDRVFRQLGLPASIGKVKHPRPNTTVLEQVVISDPDSGVVSRLHAVEVQETSETLELRLVHPEIRADRIDLLFRAIQQHVMRQQLLDRSIDVTCPQLVLLSPDAQSDDLRPTATIENANCRIAATAKGCKLDLRFSPPGTQGAPPCQVVVEKQGSVSEGSAVKLIVDTRDHFISCSAFSALFPPLKHLGAECQFRGKIQGQLVRSGWSGNISGEFAQLDLYQLIQDQFPHVFDGLATVNIAALEFQNSQIVRASGRLRSARGVIGNSLIQAAADKLGCGLDGELTGMSTRFRTIDISFEVSTKGVTIAGNCQANPTTLIEGQFGEPLLKQPASSQPLAALARMLVPDSDVQVPLTRETSKLLSVFPIPSIETHKQSGLPRATLRLN